MIKRIQKSIVFRMGALMIAMVTLAMASMLSSYFIADKAERDAEAVNLSGSLRMQSFQILADIITMDLESRHPEHSPVAGFGHRASAYNSLGLLEDRLTGQVLQAEASEEEGSELQAQYLEVQQQWFETVRPKLENHIEGETRLSPQFLRNLISDFVLQLDAMVKLYQGQAEDRVANLRFVQALALFSTLALVAVSLLILHHHLEVPLRFLTQAARKIGKGDFSEKVAIENQDELGLLANTINQMSSDLARMYATLESQVAEKTKALKKSADSLNFLYHVAREVSEKNLETVDFQDWLKELVRITQIENIDMCLKTPEATIPYEHLRNDYFSPLSTSCNRHACVTCMVSNAQMCKENGHTQMRYPLLKENIKYGVMVVHLIPGEVLSSWQHQVLQSFADQVSVSLSLRNQADQERRVALMNERTVIARELHDSLAQSLSYLKIQVTRLNRQLTKTDMQSEPLDEITSELKEGITSAYRQLRELLTTFRLSVSEKGLKAAVAHTVEQLQEQHPSMELTLDYKITDIPFSPHEEIHLLQLTREALQNATRHSRGTEVNVIFSNTADKHITLEIRDDGIGIPEDPEKMNHYGLAIMRERSRNLKGELHIRRRKTGGTEVVFDFIPDYASEKIISSPSVNEATGLSNS